MNDRGRFVHYPEEGLWNIVLRPALTATMTASFSVRLNGIYWNLCVSWSGGGTTSYSGVDRLDLLRQAAVHAENRTWVQHRSPAAG